MNQSLSRLAYAFMVCGIAVSGQTTQGLISGRILDIRSNSGIAGAVITVSSLATNTNAAARTDETGQYSLPLLPPGLYRVRADCVGFQGQEAQELSLLVAGRLLVDFQLRPLSDIWEAGQFRSYVLPGNKTIVTYFGPDLDETRTALLDPKRAREGTLEATVSSVIDPLQLENLPLAGRDVYNLLVIQAGVTSDGGTSRGLGLSVSGQRPTASNFLLDGVENNNYLITGPLVAVAPEAVQEYRVSSSNYSAEYGRTAGFLANAVTRGGGNSWHGAAYAYAQNEALDANTFRRNLQGEARKHDRQWQPGVQARGPILRNRLFVSGSYEYFHGVSQSDLDPAVTLPSANLVNFVPVNTQAHDLLTRFPTPAPSVAACSAAGLNSCTVSITMAQPVTLERNLGLARLDYISASGRHRVFGRVNINRVSRPDFIWSPYKQFVSPLQDPTASGVVSHVYAVSPRLTNEAKASFSSDNLHWNRANAGIPALLTRFGAAVTLPGPYQQIYPYSNGTQSAEALDSLVWTGGRHILKVGAGLLLRGISGSLSPEQAGIYRFNTLASFAQDTPANVEVSLLRGPAGVSANLATPDFHRDYRYNQYFAFAQDTFQVLPRLTLNFGLRYEHFGAPVNVGNTKDVAFANGALVFPAGGDQPLFGSDDRNFGVRLGASYSPTESLVIRAAYGIFFDHPFDNLWQTVRNNAIFFSLNSLPAAFRDYLGTPARQALALQSAPRATGTAPNITYFQNNLRNGYAQNMFLGVQQRLAGHVSLEVNGLSSLGRELLTNDFPGRPVFTNVVYRGNQGISDYYALAATARYQSETWMLQATYTWSHSIDNQSDALGLEVFDFGFSSSHQVSPGFLKPGDSRGDRGNSDFDQRQNLVFAGVVSLPGVFKGWTISGLEAFRTGFPFSVYGATLSSRAYVVAPTLTVLARPVSQDGGLLLLNKEAFGLNGGGAVSGRNAFRGPGFYSADLSIARNFRLPGAPESMRLGFRMDAYNVLNHANLDNPDNLLSDTGFGVASYGRLGVKPTFPTLTPLGDIARQVQVSMKLSF